MDINIRQQKLTKTNGFTLVELLVTVAVMGILSSISVANYNNFKSKANDAQAISYVRNALTAFEVGRDVIPVGQYPGMQISPGGVETSLAPYTFANLFPGITHQADVRFVFLGSKSDVTTMHACHCKGSQIGSGANAGKVYCYRYTTLALVGNPGKLSKIDTSIQTYGSCS